MTPDDFMVTLSYEVIVMVDDVVLLMTYMDGKPLTTFLVEIEK